MHLFMEEYTQMILKNFFFEYQFALKIQNLIVLII